MMEFVIHFASPIKSFKHLEIGDCCDNVIYHDPIFTTSNIIREHFFAFLKQNPEEMVFQYYMHSDIFSKFKSSIIPFLFQPSVFESIVSETIQYLQDVLLSKTKEKEVHIISESYCIV